MTFFTLSNVSWGFFCLGWDVQQHRNLNLLHSTCLPVARERGTCSLYMPISQWLSCWKGTAVVEKHSVSVLLQEEGEGRFGYLFPLQVCSMMLWWFFVCMLHLILPLSFSTDNHPSLLSLLQIYKSQSYSVVRNVQKENNRIVNLSS